MMSGMRKILGFGMIGVFCGSLALAQNIRSAVSINGLDANSCTIASPCRTFGAAIDATNAFGEVIVLTSGGYGPFTIDQSVSIVSPEGIHAAIAPTIGSAITVDGAGEPINVVLRNLFLNSQGASIGIDVASAGQVLVENCIIHRFHGGGPSYGILFRSNVPTYLAVTDSRISSNGFAGIGIHSTWGPASVMIERSRIEGNGDRAISVAPVANVVRTVIADSLISGNGRGIQVSDSAGTSETLVERCLITHNTSNGILGGTGTSRMVRVSGSTITANGIGVATTSGDNLATFLNNRLQGNGTNGAFTSSPPQN